MISSVLQCTTYGLVFSFSEDAQDLYDDIFDDAIRDADDAERVGDLPQCVAKMSKGQETTLRSVCKLKGNL